MREYKSTFNTGSNKKPEREKQRDEIMCKKKTSNFGSVDSNKDFVKGLNKQYVIA